MKVILLENIRNLGKLGAQVNVANGYGRNFLLPQGKAISATETNISKFEAKRAELELIAKERLSLVHEKAEAITKLGMLLIPVLASEEGKLYGSVGSHEITQAFAKHSIVINRSEVSLPHGAIRELGEFAVEVHLHADVIVAINIKVVPEK